MPEFVYLAKTCCSMAAFDFKTEVLSLLNNSGALDSLKVLQALLK